MFEKGDHAVRAAKLKYGVNDVESVCANSSEKAPGQLLAGWWLALSSDACLACLEESPALQGLARSRVSPQSPSPELGADSLIFQSPWSSSLSSHSAP